MKLQIATKATKLMSFNHNKYKKIVLLTDMWLGYQMTNYDGTMRLCLLG